MGAREHHAFVLPARVVLAHEPAFSVGVLHVDPPRRQVSNGGRSEIIEPRVMQVLVALARAGDAIITRDELIEACWDGRIVGDDAVNRALSRIRRIAAGIGDRSFTIETITRVGYRLVRADVAPAPRVSRPSVERRTDRRGAMLGAAALAVAAGGVWVASTRGPGPPAEAKALYDRAIAIRQEEKLSSNRQAVTYLREAVRIAPDFGVAWGALALAYRGAMISEPPDRVAGFGERLQEAARIAELHDPGNADAAAARLPIDGPFGRWSDFERLAREAIERHPRHPLAYSLLGSALMDVGRWSDAADALARGKSLAPSSPVGRYKLIVSLWSTGRISAAEQEIGEAMRLWPQHGAIWQTRLKILALSGRPAEALALASDSAATPLEEEDAPDQEGRLLFFKALVTRSASDVERAIAHMLRTAREVELDRVTTALRATALGHNDLALDLLEGVYLGRGTWATRSVQRSQLVTNPLFQPHARPLWREPRFAGIISATGLESYWRSTGTRPDYRR